MRKNPLLLLALETRKLSFLLLNKDALAYKLIGIDEKHIFIINPEGNITSSVEKKEISYDYLSNHINDYF